MNDKRIPSIIERILNNDCTIAESDFFAPPDKRNIIPDASRTYYDYREDFNELCELEDL